MICESDILYEDDKIRILKPEVKKGVLVFHIYQETPDIVIPDIGLKSGVQLQNEGIDTGRSVFHPYIFFRAPFYSRKIDYTSIETEILSSYDPWVLEEKNIIFMRVDPRGTKIYSSEIRASRHPSEWENSEKFMTKYLSVIANNKIDSKEKPKGKTPFWNLFSSELRYFPSYHQAEYPWNSYPIHRCSEVLASIPHIPPEYFVNKNG